LIGYLRFPLNLSKDGRPLPILDLQAKAHNEKGVYSGARKLAQSGDRRWVCSERYTQRAWQ